MRGAMCTHLRRSPQQKHHFAYTEAGASARGDVYASAQKPAAKTSFCVYRSRRVCEGQCVRICAESSQRKHDFAYTNTGASARGDVYAFMQKPSAKASFCVYRNRGVCRDIVYASMQKPSMKASFCVYRSWGICEGQCVRICAESFSKNIILRIQKPARLRGAMYTLLRRSPQRKHHFAYTDAEASARGDVYASAQKPAAKASFCVYISWGVCERHCIRFYSKTCSEIVILRTHCVASPGATFTWTTLCRQIAIPNGRLCRQRRHTRISAIRLLISMIKELNVVLIGVVDKGRIIHRKADLPQRGVDT